MTETARGAMERDELLRWLREDDERRLEALWARADAVRREMVGDEVHLRGLVEFSNFCARECAYCGLRVSNRTVTRYRMTADEILACARKAVAFGYGTLVLQSGEDLGTDAEWLADVIRRVKAETPLAVTLSLGEREDDELRLWYAAGADRYLLRFETSNPTLFERIHPRRARGGRDRIAMLHALADMGYQIGSGVMVGVPGQSYADLANDIEMFRSIDLDMIGVGPYISHPETPLGQTGDEGRLPDGEQVPATELMTYKAVALTRLHCPRTNIPATTALATVNTISGRELALMRGANIVMPNLTPLAYRKLYEIYPGKACIEETASQCHACLRRRLASIGRTPGTGRGDARASKE